MKSAEELEMTEEQRLNLAKLAVGLHDNQQQLKTAFTMRVFAEDDTTFGSDGRPITTRGSYSPANIPNECKTCACAVGHGPLFGIGAIPLEDDPDVRKMGEWPVYAARTFSADSGMTRTPVKSACPEYVRFSLLFDECLEPHEDSAAAADRMLAYLRAGAQIGDQGWWELCERDRVDLGDYTEEEWKELRNITGHVKLVR